MTRPDRLLAAFVAATILSISYAQNPEATVYTDPGTGIIFDTWNIQGNSKAGGLTFGMALPETALESDASELIGYLNCGSQNSSTSKGWCGIALGGSMTNGLLFLAYPHKDKVMTSLRFTPKYTMPSVYTGNATVSQITSRVNATSFSVIFHCRDCLHWSQNSTTGSAPTSSGLLDLGYAKSVDAPGNPSCPDEATIMRHDLGGTWTAMLDEAATDPSYNSWRSRANSTVSTCSNTSRLSMHGEIFHPRPVRLKL
ncbi:hypothetical protein BDV25DRAFT_136566 [Aspergillus avenaceus]|uniref:Cellobiose dehydrogenase-like cytochrome domain-containing protein n=1 Tax=Aspergillus avenaceus TaxID=36643 RepID=A0A5N6U5E7_ASPAV|nr:hypothetical protein BDV25DRAFT_136566 [Aspergillus avenaceus]